MSTSVASSNKSLNEIGSGSISDSEKESDNESAVGERLRGDGQEQDQSATKKVDDDEDRRNPQYIPKRGNFYEHDDRTIELDEEKAPGETPSEANVEVGGGGDAKSSGDKENPKNKKKIWEEKEHERWGHDLYIEKEQFPKSKQELINAYGYDIRNEDGPPRARRRRRYGRGPNKYTRNWEDEDAYGGRPPGTRPPRRPNKNAPLTKEDFPPLENQVVDENDFHNKSREIKNSAWKKNKKRTSPNRPADNKDIQFENEKSNRSRPSKNIANNQVANERPPRANREHKTEPAGPGPRQKLHNAKPSRSENQSQQEPSVSGTISSQSFSNSNRNKTTTSRDLNPDQIVREMENLKLDESSQFGYNPRQNQTNSPHSVQRHHQPAGDVNQHLPQIPQSQPSPQQRAGGPKRYSSLRQRSLPETTPPSFNQQNNQPHQVPSGYYQSDYGSQSPGDGHGMHQIPSGRPIHGSGPSVNVHHQNLLVAASQQPLMSLPPPNANPSQASPHQHMSAIAPNQPMQLAGQYGATSPGAYQVAAATYNLPAAPAAAAAYLQQPPPAVINYAASGAGPQPPAQYSPAGYPHPAPYQQPYPPAPVPASQELYQSQGGITYYSPHSQQVIPRAPVRRAKAAIPILAPPEHSKPRGRGRSSPPNDNNLDCSNNGTGPMARGRGRMSPVDTPDVAKGRIRVTEPASVPFDNTTTNQIIASMTKSETNETTEDKPAPGADNVDTKELAQVAIKKNRASDYFSDSNIDDSVATQSGNVAETVQVSE